MDEVIKNALEQAIAAKKPMSSLPWEPDKPLAQPWHAWDDGKSAWEPVHDPQRATNITALAVYTWNIDFMLPFPDARMSAAVAHLEKLISQDASTPAVIGLQECTKSDLVFLAENDWIRDNFYMTDVDNTSWGSFMYGTTTLVDRRLPVSSCFRAHFTATNMERDGLFVDIALNGKTLRLCNTHLESLIADPPLRPTQMRIISGYMREVAAAIVAGDFNAIQPFDESLHSDNGLKDAYLELGGTEGAEEGKTWGQQALRQLREQFGCSRMDKLFFCGDVKALAVERFGNDVVVEGEEADRLEALGFEKAWVTDHLGLCAVFEFGGH